MPLTGSQPAQLLAQAGIMRAGTSRANVTSPKVFVSIGGVQYATARAVAGQQVDQDTLTINEVQGETPNTGSFTVRGFQPTDGQDVVITLGSINNLDRQLAGTILFDDHSYVGTPANGNDVVNVIDYTWQLMRETITQRWTNVSATVIAQAIIAHANRGFTFALVAAGLPVLDEFTVTNRTHAQALTALCARFGGTWKTTYFKDVRLGIGSDPSQTDPITLTAAHPTLTAFKVRRDLGPVITRQPVEGEGSTASAATANGSISLSVVDASPFSSAGGLVVSGPQVISYTGVSGSAIVAARPAPPTVPTATHATGGGTPDASGLWAAESTFVYSDGVESTPSPASNTVTVTAAPDAIALTLDLGDARVIARRVYLKLPAGSTFDGNTFQTFYTTPGVYQANDNIVTSLTVSAQTFGSTRHPPAAAGYGLGQTYVYVADTSSFSAGGGMARTGAQTFTYTGRTVASGFGALTGIPASGAGSISSAIPLGATIGAGAGGGAQLTGIPASGPGSILYAINQGDPVNLRVVIDDLAAQATIAALIGGGDDGVIEGVVIQDGRISETEARARGVAQLALSSAVQLSVNAVSRDKNMRASRSLGVNLVAPTSVTGTFALQQVTVTNFQPALLPTRTAQASSTRFTIDDLLRIARGGA